jgi:NACalpha-BTF3-like transcription factor
MKAATSAFLFWGITLFGAAFAVWGLTTPFVDIAAETRTAETELATSLDRLRLLASQVSQLRQQPLPDLARYATAGVDVTTEATRLQERARQVVASAEGSVLGSQANQQELPEGDVKITVLIQAQVSEAQLMTALDSLETGAAPFVIETLTLDFLPGVSDGRNLNAVLTLSRLVTHAP